MSWNVRGVEDLEEEEVERIRGEQVKNLEQAGIAELVTGDLRFDIVCRTIILRG